MSEPDNDCDALRKAIVAWAHGAAVQFGGKLTAEEALEALLAAFRSGLECRPGEALAEDPGRLRSATASGCGDADPSIRAAPTFAGPPVLWGRSHLGTAGGDAEPNVTCSTPLTETSK